MNALERINIIDSINDDLDALDAENLGAIERLDIIDRVNDNLDKLDASDSEPYTPEESLTILDQIIAGQFNGLSIADLSQRLRDGYAEEEDLGKVKEAAIVYLEANRAQLEAA